MLFKNIVQPCSVKKVFLNSGKHLCQTVAEVFSWEFGESLKNTFFTKHLCKVAFNSQNRNSNNHNQSIRGIYIKND